MKSILLPLALCAGLAGCATYDAGYVGYDSGYYGYGNGYYSQPGYYYGGGSAYAPVWDHRAGRRGPMGDRDGDGIRNRRDRDRDNDGVRNRLDERPNNPRRS